MKCPADSTELEPIEYESTIEVDACKQCGGIFLDRGELQDIQEVREHDYRAQLQQLPDLVGRAQAAALARSKPAINCPRCHTTMNRREHGYNSQILVDVCPDCRGIWLDRGELEALEVFFERIQQRVGDQGEAEEIDPAAARREARRSYFWKLREMFGGIT